MVGDGGLDGKTFHSLQYRANLGRDTQYTWEAGSCTPC